MGIKRQLLQILRAPNLWQHRPSPCPVTLSISLCEALGKDPLRHTVTMLMVQEGKGQSKLQRVKVLFHVIMCSVPRVQRGQEPSDSTESSVGYFSASLKLLVCWAGVHRRSRPAWQLSGTCCKSPSLGCKAKQKFTGPFLSHRLKKKETQVFSASLRCEGTLGRQ